MAWPPTNSPFPQNGPNPRQSITWMDPYHVQDHNDINNGVNSIVDRIKSREKIQYHSAVTGEVTLDLDVARTFSVNPGSGGVSSFKVTNRYDVGYNTNDFTIILVNSIAGQAVSWELKDENDASLTVYWPNGAEPTLSNDAGSVHVLYFTWFLFGYMGFVVAEEMKP